LALIIIQSGTKIRIQRARTLSAFFYLFLKRLYTWILYFIYIISTSENMLLLSFTRN